MIKDELTERIRAAFSVEPLPEEYWRDGVDLSGDIPEELSARIVRRPWNEISITDWTMTGAHASIARGYLNANAVRYYLPSLLLVGLDEIGYIDWTLECLLPAGRRRKTTSEWWQTFYAGFTQEQRAVVRQYLAFVRLLPVGPANQGYIEQAMPIWDS
jgi:hypothetical protein